jgi:uncharacterized protein YkwD
MATEDSTGVTHEPGRAQGGVGRVELDEQRALLHGAAGVDGCEPGGCDARVAFCHRGFGALGDAGRMCRRLASLALLAAFAGCGGSDDPPPAPAPSVAPPTADIACGLADFEATALALVNRARTDGADCGVHGRFGPAPLLDWSDRLAAAAYGHSADMAARDYFGHEGQDGRTVGRRVSDEGYAWRAVGENIAGGPRSVAQVVDGWMASDGHCANMMNPAYRHMGLACAAAAASTYGRYWTLDLAAPG